MFNFWTFETKEDAEKFKKDNRWRKGTISYSDYWKCWILAR